MLSRTFFVALILVIAACTPIEPPPPPFEPPMGGTPVPVQAVWSGNDLVVTNNTAFDVYFAAFPVRLLPVILWTPVTNPNTTLKTASRSTARFPRSRFSANNPDTLHFSWWHLGTKLRDSLYNPDSVRGFRVYP
jgi:hypothetical protein